MFFQNITRLKALIILNCMETEMCPFQSSLVTNVLRPQSMLHVVVTSHHPLHHCYLSAPYVPEARRVETLAHMLKANVRHTDSLVQGFLGLTLYKLILGYIKYIYIIVIIFSFSSKLPVSCHTNRDDVLLRYIITIIFVRSFKLL